MPNAAIRSLFEAIYCKAWESERLDDPPELELEPELEPELESDPESDPESEEEIVLPSLYPNSI